VQALILFLRGLPAHVRWQFVVSLPRSLQFLLLELPEVEPPPPIHPTLVIEPTDKAGVLARRRGEGTPGDTANRRANPLYGEGLWHPGDLQRDQIPKGINQRAHHNRNGSLEAGEWEALDWEEREVEESQDWELADELAYWRENVKPVHFPERETILRRAA
jgi:hypothetical protein